MSLHCASAAPASWRAMVESPMTTNCTKAPPVSATLPTAQCPLSTAHPRMRSSRSSETATLSATDGWLQLQHADCGGCIFAVSDVCAWLRCSFSLKACCETDSSSSMFHLAMPSCTLGCDICLGRGLVGRSGCGCGWECSAGCCAEAATRAQWPGT